MVSTFESYRGGFEDEWGLIDPERLKLFRNGVNYRSRERARGAGVLAPSRESVKDYFDFREEEQEDLAAPT